MGQVVRFPIRCQLPPQISAADYAALEKAAQAAARKRAAGGSPRMAPIASLMSLAADEHETAGMRGTELVFALRDVALLLEEGGPCYGWAVRCREAATTLHDKLMARGRLVEAAR